MTRATRAFPNRNGLYINARSYAEHLCPYISASICVLWWPSVTHALFLPSHWISASYSFLQTSVHKCQQSQTYLSCDRIDINAIAPKEFWLKNRFIYARTRTMFSIIFCTHIFNVGLGSVHITGLIGYFDTFGRYLSSTLTSLIGFGQVTKTFAKSACRVWMGSK